MASDMREYAPVTCQPGLDDASMVIMDPHSREKYVVAREPIFGVPTGSYVLPGPSERKPDVGGLGWARTRPSGRQRPHLPAHYVNPDRVLDSHYVRKILEDVQHLTHTAQTPGAAVHACNLFGKISSYVDQFPQSPGAEVMAAFHDALAYENRWTEFSAGEYESALSVLRLFFQSPNPTPKRAAKAIIQFEKRGFNTIPFECDDDWSEDDTACGGGPTE